MSPSPKVRPTPVQSTTIGLSRAGCHEDHPSVIEPYDAFRRGRDRETVGGDNDRGAAGGGVGKEFEHTAIR